MGVGGREKEGGSTDSGHRRTRSVVYSRLHNAHQLSPVRDILRSASDITCPHRSWSHTHWLWDTEATVGY